MTRQHTMFRKIASRLMLSLALLLVAAGARAQTTESNGYIIYYDGFLTHEASGAVVLARAADFDLSTCLWTISGNYIRPVLSDGSTVLGGLYLRPRNGNTSYTLNTSTSTTYAEWSGGLSEGGQPYYGTNRYLRVTGSTGTNPTWQVNTSNSSRGTIYAVTKTSTILSKPASYDGTLTGATEFFSAGATATYVPSVTYTSAYNLKTVTYRYSGGELASETTGTAPAPTAVDLSDGWTIEWSLSDDTYATISTAGVFTVKSTMPATFATTTVNYIAIKDGITVTASIPVTIYASEEVLDNITGGNQGVSGGVVTLNDYEDHNWSYYSDATLPEKMRSLNPANVKITYYGNANNSVSTSTAVSPALNTFTASTNNSVAVGIGEPESTFVYYKTLERTSGSTYGSATYDYTTIPNPFSIRPTYGTGNTRWRGFYAWRIKSISGGSISGKSVGDIIDAETSVSFIPAAEYGMTVELEALWAPAEVITGTSFSRGYNSVERNFLIVSNNTGSTLDAVKIATPCTYTSFYPNGTTDGTNAATLANRNTRRATFTPTADSKVEYMLLNGNNYDINADAHNLTLGRGISAAGGTYCVNNFHPVNDNKTTALDFRLRLETGVYNRIYLMSNNSTLSGRVYNNFTFGSDYDRAKGDDEKLDVAQSNQINFATPQLGAANKDQPVLDITVKSGQYQKSYWNDNNNAQYSYSFYCHSTQNSSYPGLVSLTVEGGHFASINGGRGSSTEGRITPDSLAFTMRFRGGTVENSIYGAASNNPTYGSRRLIFTGGEVKGWIAAGCNGTGNDNEGQVVGNSFIYVGGNMKVGDADNARNNNGTPGGNVFGAGRGNASQRASITNSHVAVADQADVLHDVYGGGFHGYITNTSNIYILGGTTHGNVFGGGSENGDVSATVPRQIPNVNITMDGGLVEGGIYGGSFTNGIVSTLVRMQIDGGQVGTVSQTANIHGGGFGEDTRVNGNVEVTLGTTTQTTPGVIVYGDVYGGSALGTVNTNTSNHTNVTLNKGIINGSLYGGALGSSAIAANVNGPVLVTINGGTVNTTSEDGSGAVYGCNNINGAPQSTVAVIINGTDPAPGEDTYALDAVYGGGNRASYAAGTPTVTVNNCDNSIAYVYGGGNAAHITNGDTDVTIYGGNKIGNVFGGGNGQVEAANISGDTSVKIHGGTIGNVFGGSNTQGTIGGTISVLVNKEGTCAMHIDEVYGGGNKAPSNAGQVTVVCTGDEGEGIGDVYGGARAADVTGDITLDISGGSIERLFGGNNVSGGISGDIVINIDWDEPSSCGKNYLGYVYGAGNKANYAGGPVVNIKNGTVSHDAFGGGLEAAVGGSVVVNMLGGSVLGALYGGGALAHTNTNGGATTVNLVGGTVNDVYGGGLGQKKDFFDATEDIEAYVYGDVSVILNGSGETGATNDCKVTGRIFGCNNLNGSPKGHVLVHVFKTVGYDDDHKKSTNKDNTTYDVAAVYGGGNMAAYVPNNPATTTEATEVIIDGCDDSSIQYVYGGGNAASVPATNVTVNGSYEIGNIFGGGNGKDKLFNGTDWVDNDGANVGYYADGTTAYGTGEALVNAFGGTLHYVFGGSNTLGNVRTEAVAYLDEKFRLSCPLIIDEVYGGGNEAPMSGDIQIKLGCITSLSEIYGGARLANVGSADKNCDVVLNITSGHFDRVFGGNNIDGIIYGSITVNIEETGCHPITIGELYGCGNQAPYTTPAGKADPTINVKSFTSIGRIFGGGLGAGAVVTGNPTININETLGDNALQTSDYAGTTRTLTDGSTVDLPAHTSGEMGVIGSVFGGGNAAEVKGNTTVNIGTLTTVDYVTMSEGETTLRTGLEVKGANIIGNVFGGGNQADVTGSTNVVVGKE